MMAAVHDFIDKVDDFFFGKPSPKLSDFQKRKLVHEFELFFDMNKDGCLQWRDFELAKKQICELSGWKAGSPKYNSCHELFTELWRSLQDTGDDDLDGKVSKDEWFALWTSILRAKYEWEREQARKNRNKKNGQQQQQQQQQQLPPPEADDYVPKWFNKYVEYKFDLYDRAGDNVIDADEFEYSLGLFNISSKDCSAAYKLMTRAGEQRIDRPYFRELALQFFLSDEAGDLGNFINGRLTYDA